MAKYYYSNAAWTKHDNTKDRHDTEEQAKAVCGMLDRDYTVYTPCPTRGICVEAWVTEGDE